MYDPERRITAEEAIEHQYFKSVPVLKVPDQDQKSMGLD